ncbi:hypothetical protein B0H15DRAFT_918569 [Mycena belliarum]|uniref:Uncharacterized protein n=1 Tax=Mycena belliarum TaxID=1033014 RepID=A0AAD6TKL1_9AGAR|nr:hypothetical protein B0H15DRAFT_918569 [Mycena belliae]
MSRETWHKRAGVYITAFLVGLTFVSIFWLLNQGKGGNTAQFSFHVSFGDQVALRITNAKHYSLDDDDEWSKILPASGHLIHVTEDDSGSVLPRPYTVTLFHQLKCLDIIRTQYKQPPGTPIHPRTRHCMNYLRQILLCRPNLRLEAVEDEFGLTDRYSYDTVCRDWSSLYDEVERNQLAYAKWKEEKKGRDDLQI